MTEKSTKVYTKDQAFRKAGDYCAYQERCQQEMRDKLYAWGIYGDDVEAVIAQLVSENFINEERFAKAFAGGKFRIKKWGKGKIVNELKHRRISEYCIRKALDEIPDDEYEAALKTIIEKKAHETHDKQPYVKWRKVAAYAISRGYESELVWSVIKEMVDM